MENEFETASLNLLSDLQRELAEALNSLGGQQGRGLYDNYLFYSASHINRAAEGFVFLRRANGIEASKHLVRPPMETMIRIEAVRKQPDLLFRIAFTEHQEDGKWFRAAAIRAEERNDPITDQKQWDEFEAKYAAQWDDFKAKYAAQFPNHPLVEKELSVFSAAEVAGGKWKDYYNSFYRMYCKYSHGAMRAIGGYLTDLATPEDNLAIGLSVFSALDALISIGAKSPNFDALRERMNKIQDSVVRQEHS